jgi:hypothetical protein
MAKATNPRKPSGEKRKDGAAAKRAGGQRVTAARKLTVATARPRSPARMSARPTNGLTRQAGPEVANGGAQAISGGGEGERAEKVVVPEAERVAPPLPVPIASFTF